MTRLILVLLLALPMTVAAQIYKTTDEQGNVVYTDKPPGSGGSAEEIQLKTTNTASPPPEIVRPTPPPAEEESQAPGYTVDIVSPANETTIPMGPGNFLLSGKVDPALAAGQSLQLHVDGVPWGEPQTSASWALTNVYRGGHDFTISVMSPEDKPLATSAPIRIYVMRPSINNKNRN